MRLIGIRCDDCGFSVDGYLRTIEAVRKWNALEVTEEDILLADTVIEESGIE